mmetsp:Transcript_21245/g.52286  ORF Transcript_21245/g.52286 Transcript_21245/m.52286 type:complete len:496 (-) Transcript_21245:1529-3016(-)
MTKRASRASLVLLAACAACIIPASHAFSSHLAVPLRPQHASACVSGKRGGTLRRVSPLVSLRASESDKDQRRAAEEEAERWKRTASQMEAQRSLVKDGGESKSVEDTDLSDLSSLEGAKLPQPSMGELDSLMARAEAFKAKQQADVAKPEGSKQQLPRRLQGTDRARGLVGGDSGSMRQAAPYQPGESKAGASQEGWTDDQLEKILNEEAKWKEQLKEKQEEEKMANKLADEADSFLVIGPSMKAEKGVPSSMENAVVQALLSSVEVMKRGCGTFRLDVDVSRDETYTTLKNSIPFTRVYCKGLAVNGFKNLRIIMPDPGSAALANRDWAKGDGHNAVAFERFGDTPVGDDDDAVVVIAAAATEIEKVKTLAISCAEKGVPLILINPSVKSPGGENLGSLGAYSLGLSEFLSRFETAYYLRTVPYGIMHRQYPQPWGVYEEGPSGYTFLESTNGVPSGEQLEDIYQRAHPEVKPQGGVEGFTKGLGKFIKNYSKG